MEITRAEARDYAEKTFKYDAGFRVTDKIEEVPDGTNEGLEGIRVEVKQREDDDYRGLKAGEWVGMVVYKKNGRRGSHFAADAWKKVKAAAAEYRRNR